MSEGTGAGAGKIERFVEIFPVPNLITSIGSALFDEIVGGCVFNSNWKTTDVGTILSFNPNVSNVRLSFV